MGKNIFSFVICYPLKNIQIWVLEYGLKQRGGLKSFPCSACPLPLVSIITYTPVSTISFIDWKLSMPWVISLKIMDFYFYFFMLSCSTTHMFEVHVVYVYANTYKKKCVCKYISVFSLKVCSCLLFSICVWIHSDVAILCPETEGFFLTFLCLFYSDVAWILIIKYLVNHDFLAFLW